MTHRFATLLRRLGLAGSLAAGVWLTAAPAGAQQRDSADLRREAEAQLGEELSQAEILARLRSSGMTRAQARARLQALGYDPGVADAYFDALEAGNGEAPSDDPSPDLLRAMQQLGVTGLPRGSQEDLADSVVAYRLERDSLILMIDSLLTDSTRLDSLRREARLPIFGMELFSTRANQFAPVTWGPVGPDYRLGPGDELVLILTGDVETSYDLEVTREGFVVIPDVGRVQVAGMTVGELEGRLYDRLGSVYSGVERGPDATTQFQVSLGNLRPNEVYLVGELQRPGAYQVSAVSTVLNALYQAGGPNRDGSFRAVQVRRGNRLVATVDLYEYLLTGGSGSDLRLENGDRVFVPIVQRRVSIDGQVRRTARYELKEGETLTDLIAFAGGFRPEAVVSRVQIDRVLPAAERRPGVDRVLIDVAVDELAGGDVELIDGDQVTVFAVADERRHRVEIHGQVHRPGLYQWTAGMTLGDLIRQAEGLTESAYAERAQIFRHNGATGMRSLVPASLVLDAAGNPVGRDVQLADRDSVVILSRAVLVVPDSVEIAGFVKEPGRYELAAGMSVQDLVLAAGGFTEGANLLEAELARLADPTNRSDTSAIIYRVPLADSAAALEAARVGVDRMLPTWATTSQEVALMPSDRVLIGQATGWQPPATVVITGEVRNPGPYALSSRRTRVADVIARAGGLTRDAFASGIQLVRDSTTVGVDLEEALEDGDDEENVLLVDGDSLHVPRYDPMVRVTGAVVFESRVAYEPGAGLDYYIEQAGGFARNADKRRTSVTYPSGERETISRFLWFSNKPEPGPGSMIFVPSVPADATSGTNWSQIVQTGTAVLGTVATLIFAYTQINN